jgi:hypothetical protein
MLDNPITQFFISGWPVMMATPGVAFILLVVGFIVGWLLKSAITKEHVRALEHKVGIADRHKEYVEDKFLDAQKKQESLTVLLEKSTKDIGILNYMIENGRPTKELSSVSASISANVYDLSMANEELRGTISTVSAGYSTIEPAINLESAQRYFGVRMGSLEFPTNPPAEGRPSLRPPEWPPKK